jgi:hypothetical protein
MPNKFLNILDDIRHLNWSVWDDGCIRNDRGECPICAYANIILNPSLPYTTEGMSAFRHLPDYTVRDEYEAAVFMIAVDAGEDPIYQELRQEILTRLNLTEHAK